MIETLTHTVKYALRDVRRSRVFTAVAVLTFALGIGVNIAAFSVLDRLLFRALPYDAPEQLVLLRACPQAGGECQGSFPSVVAYEASGLASFSRVAVAADTGEYRFTREAGGEAPIRLTAVSPDLLRVLGVAPIRGRDFSQDDARLERRVAIISYESWQRRYDGEAGILGREVWSRPGPTTIIGVLPRGFIPPTWTAQDPRWDGLVLDARDGWGAIAPTGSIMAPIARLKPGVTLEQARADVAGLVSGLGSALEPRGQRAPAIRLDALQQTLFSGFRSNFFLILGTTALLLVLACANLATLLLAHGRSREHDIAITAALGASRSRVLLQSIAASLLICLIGSAAAIGVLVVAFSALRASLPPLIARYATDVTDPRVVVLALTAAMVCAVAAGALPSLRAARVDLLTVLQRASKSSRGSRLRGGAGLLAVETAMGVLLVLGALLMLSSFRRLAGDDIGFDPDDLYAVGLDIPQLAPEAALTRYEQALDALRDVPGVVAVAGSDSPAGAGMAPMWGFTSDRSVPGGRFEVTADYFETIGTRVVAGRAFSEAEVRQRAPLAIVSVAGARAVFPDSPVPQVVGQTLRLAGETARTIVGVVQDVKMLHGQDDVRPALYVPLGTRPRVYPSAVMRMAPGTQPTFAAVRQRLVDRLGSAAPSLTPVTARLDSALQDPQFRAVLFITLAGAGLLLAATGLFAVAAFDVRRREHEMGVRVSLGATARQIQWKIVTETCRPVAFGLVAGFVAAYWWTTFLQRFLYEIDPRNPGLYVAVAVIFGATAIVAAWLPARRAGRIDPVVVLRGE